MDGGIHDVVTCVLVMDNSRLSAWQDQKDCCPYIGWGGGYMTPSWLSVDALDGPGGRERGADMFCMHLVGRKQLATAISPCSAFDVLTISRVCLPVHRDRPGDHRTKGIQHAGVRAVPAQGGEGPLVAP